VESTSPLTALCKPLLYRRTRLLIFAAPVESLEPVVLPLPLTPLTTHTLSGKSTVVFFGCVAGRLYFNKVGSLLRTCCMDHQLLQIFTRQFFFSVSISLWEAAGGHHLAAQVRSQRSCMSILHRPPASSSHRAYYHYGTAQVPQFFPTPWSGGTSECRPMEGLSSMYNELEDLEPRLR